MLCEYARDAKNIFHDESTYFELFATKIDESVMYQRISNATSNLIIVRIKYRTPEVKMTVQDARTTLSDKIANFGGTFGIWAELTGVSLLGIINMLIILMKIVTSVCQRNE